jgi:hypothetical protein
MKQGELAVQFYVRKDGKSVLENFWSPTDRDSFKQSKLGDLYLHRWEEYSNTKEKEVLSSYLNTTHRTEFYGGDPKIIKKKILKQDKSIKGRVFEVMECSKSPEVPVMYRQENVRKVNVGKKYKPVHLKVRPTYTDLPDKFQIVRNILGDPLAELPVLLEEPPPFEPTGRYTEERKEAFEKVHNLNFLRQKKMDLVHHTVSVHDKAFAWDDSERGSFKTEYFPPVEIPTVPHEPWTKRSIKIPPGIYNEVCKIIKTKISAGVYEPSNSLYRSRWFTVLKKGGKIANSTQSRTLKCGDHSTLWSTACHGRNHCTFCQQSLWGYDERPLAEASRDLMTFQTPFGALRLVTLPMGWTNSVPIFHNDVTKILEPEIPHVTIPYIDDVGVHGPAT